MSKKILLVEDSAPIAMNEARMLEKHGYEVLTAYKGEKAIEAVDSDPEISLILMDIDLGKGMDGTEAAEEILKKKDIPVVFLSSHTEPEVVEKTEGITSYGYVVKNSGETVLLASIKMAFRLFEAKMREKEHKKTLMHSHDLMSYIIEHSQSAIAVHDKELNYVYVSEQYLNQFNVSKRDVIGRHHYEVFPDLPQKWRDVHQRSLLGEVISEEDDPYERDDGTIDWTRWECRPWYESDGTVGGIIIYTEVITKEKRINYDIRDNINYIQSILRTTRDGFCVLDLRGNFIDVNNAYCDMSGYSREEILDMSIPDIEADETPEESAERMQRIISTGSEVFESRHRRKDGSIFNVENSASYIGGEEQKFICFCRGITERKKTEELLLQKERHYRFIYNSLRDALIVVNENREITDCNTAFTELFGYTLHEIQGKTTAILFASQDEYEQLGRKMQQQGKESNFIYQPLYRTKNGELFKGEKKVQYLRDENGKPVGFIGVIRDITERTQAEDALKEANLRLTTVIDRIDVRVCISDMDTYEIIFINESGRRIAGDIVGQKCWKALQGKDEPCSFCTNDKLVDKDGNPTGVFAWEHYNTYKGKWYDCRDSAVQWHDGRIVRLEAAIDITERRQAEENLREALKEKEFLMRELNHRVKNNLNMVSSLISLKDAETEIDLSDIQHQIEAISLIHEKLHTSENVTEINCRNYCDDLLNSIFTSFTTRKVRIEKEIEDIGVSTKNAMALGLIINEIATNAIKHGFNDKEEAVFSVTMEKDKKNNRYKLTLSNTGNPFPENVDIESTDTLGLRLINALVAQVGGTIELRKKPNPVFTIGLRLGAG